MPARTAQGFNADHRAQARENAPVKIGGKTFTPRRRTTKLIRELRKSSRDTQRIAAQAEKAEADENYDLADELQDQITEATFQSVSAMLKDDNGKSPDPAWLEEHLDVSDLAGLTEHLNGGVVEDPS